MFKSLKNDNGTKMNNMINTDLGCDMNALTSSQSKINKDMDGEMKQNDIAFKPIKFDGIGSEIHRATTAVQSMPDIPFNVLGINNIGIPSMISSKLSKKDTQSEWINQSKIDTEIDTDFVKSKVNNSNVGLIETPKIFREMTSILVNTVNADELLNGIDIELNQYSNDIEYNVNKNDYIINGLIFIMNTAVNFAINIFKENSKQLRVEFKRVDGDSIKFSTFYQDIIVKISDKFKSDIQNEIKNDTFDVNLDYSLSLGDEPKYKYIFTNNELDNFYSNLHSNTYTVDTINELYTGCLQNPKISQQILNHKKLFNEVLNKLKHKDIVCVRQTLLLINELNKSKPINIVPNISPLLCNRSYLIKIYAVKTLANVNIDWNISKNVSNNIKQNALKIQNSIKNKSFATKDFITTNMFNKIYAKLTQI